MSQYPYYFKVVSIDNGVATTLSPRSVEVSAIRSLRFIFPDLIYENDDSVRMMKAQVEMARIQSKAADLVKSHNDNFRLNGNSIGAG